MRDSYLGEAARRACGILLLTALAVSFALASQGQAASPHEASTSRQTREEAMRAMPLDKLDRNTRDAVWSIVSRPSIFRRLPTQVIDCDPDMHLFLVRHPEVIVNIWSVMGISKVAMERTGPASYRASDGAGTVGMVKYLYSSQDTHVIYAEGNYDGPLTTKPMKARCVLLLKTGGQRDASGRSFVTNRLDVFVTIDNLGVEFIAKTFQPLVNKSADYNFAETASFVSNVSHTSETNPNGMLRLAGKLQKVPAEVRQQFAETALQVAQRGGLAGSQEGIPVANRTRVAE